MATTDLVKDYYAKVLKTNKDLKTTACCSTENLPKHLKTKIEKIPEEVRAKFYGCGVPIPPALEGCTVLDLGSGSGRDCFLLSSLVGESGKVIGIDMTTEQIEIAKKYKDEHRSNLGHKTSNIDFRQGYIENLHEAGLKDQSVDCVVSNCVINLSPDKNKVFSEIWRCLKPGGELYFSDVFCDRRLPEELKEDPILLGECLSGALYIEDFRRLLNHLGCNDIRTISSSPIEITSKEVEEKLSGAKFFSITYRAFKIDLEDRCEDYRQTATYNGKMLNYEDGFSLDEQRKFVTDFETRVCKNTARMLEESRYSKYFEIKGSADKHLGLFVADEKKQVAKSSCC